MRNAGQDSQSPFACIDLNIHSTYCRDVLCMYQPVFRQHDSNANFGKIADGSLASVVRVPGWYGLLPCERTASESGLVPSQL